MTAGNRIWSYEEALSIFPLVRDRTRRAIAQIEALINRVQSPDEMAERRGELEQAHQRIVESWSAEIASLGCVVKGLWLVDWDSGDGFYCWKWPEETLGFFHSYEEGFQGRVPIA